MLFPTAQCPTYLRFSSRYAERTNYIQEKIYVVGTKGRKNVGNILFDGFKVYSMSVSFIVYSSPPDKYTRGICDKTLGYNETQYLIKFYIKKLNKYTLANIYRIKLI